MERLTCAKCNANIRRLKKDTRISSRSFPIFKITKYEDYDGPPVNIDLCKKCSEELDEWLSDQSSDGNGMYTV